jgi:two-component system chemotaxis sensor kinase CheA
MEKPKLLVIEDDLYTRDLYREILEEAGFAVETAVDGVEGLQKIQDGGFDMVLLDAMIPKLDGLSILMRVQHEVSKKPNGPIVMLTNLARDAVLKQALAAGAMACLIKTDFNPDQLVQKIKEFLSKLDTNGGDPEILLGHSH